MFYSKESIGEAVVAVSLSSANDGIISSLFEQSYSYCKKKR